MKFVIKAYADDGALIEHEEVRFAMQEIRKNIAFFDRYISESEPQECIHKLTETAIKTDAEIIKDTLKGFLEDFSTELLMNVEDIYCDFEQYVKNREERQRKAYEAMQASK